MLRVDVNAPTLVYRWLQLVPRGEDLWLCDASDDDVGTVPEWVEYDFDLDIIIDPQWRHEPSGLGWDFTCTWHEWALREGIAPWQPFLLKVPEPEYSKTWTDCGYEYDVHWDCEIVEVCALPPDQVLRRWRAWQQWRQRYIRRAVIAMQQFKHKRRRDIAAMYLQTHRYRAHGCYGEMSPPDGVAVRLCSSHTWVEGYPKGAWHDMAEGRDDDGDWEKAFERLVPVALACTEGLTAESLRALPQRH